MQVPKGEYWKGAKCANDFIQCNNSSAVAEAWEKFYQANPKPQALDGFDYRLKEDFTWELYEIPNEEVTSLIFVDESLGDLPH